ncbi:ribonuclease J [Bacteriovoracaceae bacterium]|nr:ribonuclease J [Bacteriovoracaceae bacterium]
MNNKLPSKTSFKITPLGGLQQIGSNMILVESSSTNVIIDCGILFPTEGHLGINYLIPDLNYISDINIDALIITHGHEDHIGAITHFIDRFPNVPIYTSDFTALLIRKKINELKISKKLNIYKEEHTLSFGNIRVHPVSVNHSIPETFGLFFQDINTNESFFYCSDFKIDESSIYESPFNFEKLVSLRNKASRFYLLPDSTNIISSNLETPSETSLIDSFSDIFSSDYSRIFITTFSSNIWRIKSIIHAATLNNLKIVSYGRSFKSYIAIAVENGLITPDELKSFATEQSIGDINKKHIVLLSGCQADFRSALRRVGGGEDKTYKPNSNDVFVFSSKAIPGNEKNISLLMNKISESGAKIITSSDMPIHVSGHPGRDDLLNLYDKVSPDYIFPIHGESFFLQRHCDFAASHGYKSDWLTNYSSLLLGDGYKIQYLDEDFLHDSIHGKRKVINRDQLRERRKIAERGLIIVSEFKKGFEITTQGIPEVGTFEGENFNTVDELSKSFSRIHEKIFEIVKVELRREVVKLFGYKPEVIFHTYKKASKQEA